MSFSIFLLLSTTNSLAILCKKTKNSERWREGRLLGTLGPEKCRGSDLPGVPFCLLSPRLEAEEASNQEMPVDTDCSLSPNKSLLSPSLGLGKGWPSKTEKLIAQEKLWSRPHPQQQRPSGSLGFPFLWAVMRPPNPLTRVVSVKVKQEAVTFIPAGW